jgi:hypothetical protein
MVAFSYGVLNFMSIEKCAYNPADIDLPGVEFRPIMLA